MIDLGEVEESPLLREMCKVWMDDMKRNLSEKGVEKVKDLIVDDNLVGIFFEELKAILSLKEGREHIVLMMAHKLVHDIAYMEGELSEIYQASKDDINETIH